MLERVEIFKGANSLLNGAASSGVGGMINLEPKRAEDLPTARVGVDYTSDSQVGGTLDTGRRFGDNNRFGARVSLGCIARAKALSITINAVPRWLRWGLITVAIVSAPRSISAIRRKTFHGGTMGVNISGVDFIPALPDNSKKTTARSGAIAILKASSAWRRRNMTLSDSWTVYSALGGQHSHEIGTYSAPKLLNKKTAMQRLAALILTASSTRSAAWAGYAAISIPVRFRIR